MKVSVIIPAYNAEKTVCASIESVLRQTVQPYEVLVLDDGSSDSTYTLLDSYKPRITVFRGERNQGLCAARNQLCKSATGDWISLLDADDVWHPDYIRVKCRLFTDCPEAAVFFVGHRSFCGYGEYEWRQTWSEESPYRPEVMEPLTFFRRYNKTPGLFYPSVCSFSMNILKKLGEQPFKTAAEDAYFMYSAILTGPVAYASIPLAAIRIIDGSLSSNSLKVYGGQVEAFGLLQNRYERETPQALRRAFRQDFAGTRRQYAKRLMGAKSTRGARKELWRSLGNSGSPLSLAKSAGLLAASFLPRALQPRWPSALRKSREASAR